MRGAVIVSRETPPCIIEVTESLQYQFAKGQSLRWDLKIIRKSESKNQFSSQNFFKRGGVAYLLEYRHFKKR